MPSHYRDQVESHTPEEGETSSSSSSSEESLGIMGFLSSPSSDYLVQSFLGEGVYGNVAKCIKIATGATVAVKIMKNSNLTSEGKNEMDILMKLRAFDSDKFNFIRFNNGFINNQHVCLEFEMLDISLLDFMRRKPANCLTVKEIRPILHQIATTLQLLKSIGVIHTDLKPDNIMMVDHVNQPLRIKVIDFGLARHISESEWGEYVQPLSYRSPEVILGFPCTTAIDMWALGCIAAELFTGNVLYLGNCEYDMIQQIVHTQGPLPQRLLNKGLKTTQFFQRWRRRRRCRRQWRLKTPSEHGNPWTKADFDSLDDLNKVRPACHLSDEDALAEIKDRENFVDLLKRMLHLDADKRIAPSHLLEDPFITMTDVADSYPDSLYVKSCREMMEVCQDQSSDKKNLELTDPQPSTSTASPHRNIYQVPPAWHSHQEHPLIEGITSDVSSCLSLHDLQAPSRPQQLSFSQMDLEISKDTGQDEPQIKTTFNGWRREMRRLRSLLHHSGQAPSDGPTNSPRWKRTSPEKKKRMNPDGVQTPERESPEQVQTPEKKRKRESMSPDDVQTPQRKRRRMDPDGVQTPKEPSQNSNDAPTEPTAKPQRKRMWAAFVASHYGLHQSPDSLSPERKKRKMSLDT